MKSPVAHVLAVSKNDKDIRFGREMAAVSGMHFANLTDPAKIRGHLVDHPQSLILWDGEESELIRATEETLHKFSTPNLVFVITSGPINEYPHVISTRAFGHHLYRRFDMTASLIGSRLMEAALTPFPFGLGRFFPPETKSQKIVIKKSLQKAAAVQAIQNYMQKIQINSRLAALAAQATDELVMNAIFDAAVVNGVHTRKHLERTADFELFDREEVEIEVAATPNYVGLSVSDQFGSLKKEIVHSFIGINYGGDVYVPTRGAGGAGLGLNGIVQAGISMVFVSKPGMRTEVMIFFPRVATFKKFREGFHFLSILSQ